MIKTITLPIVIDDGRIDFALRLMSLSKAQTGSVLNLVLDFSKTKKISPAGFAILSCLFDFSIEQKNCIKVVGLSKTLSGMPVLANLRRLSEFSFLPGPNIQNADEGELLLRGLAGSIDAMISERLQEKFSQKVDADVLFSAMLVINELMQNSVDHSSAERCYVYAGIWENEFHVGVLDMGVSIPAKLEQKYKCDNDVEYLKLSLNKGISTRRLRTGGFGLYYFFDHLRDKEGKLTIVSRNAQIRRYFKTRKSQINFLKYPLSGTWCFARFSLEK